MAIPHDAAFGDLLRRLRLAAGLTQQELAERAALSVRGIQALESGERRAPQRTTLDRLITGLGLSSSERTMFQAAARRYPLPPAPAEPGFIPRTNLPPDLTPFVGREREVGAVQRMLLDPQVRLLTLVGPGGIGKTRLALHTARQAAPAFPNGVYLVSLAALSDAAHVLSAIGQTLGVVETGGQSLRDRLTTRLRDTAVLVVLDNFEHLVAAAPLLGELLLTSVGLKLLVTSRMVLHVRGERRLLVGALEVPDLNQCADLALLARSPAVELFVQRAQDAFPDFVLTAANAPAIAEVCVRLGGLPLAIELAAARSNVLSLPALLRRFQQSSSALSRWFAPSAPGQLDLLMGGPHNLPARQRTIRATIEWSYTLLGADTQTLLRRLGVFGGSWTMDAAEAVCDPAQQLDVLTNMAALLDASLVQQLGEVAGERRFGMLETVREYALERLSGARGGAPADDERAQIEQRHAAYYQQLAERIEPELYSSGQVTGLAQLEADHDNLRAALQWALAGNAPDLALSLVGALGRFWFLRSHFSEWWRWLDMALAAVPADAPDAAPDQRLLRARALLGRGMLELNLLETPRAVELGTESLQLYRALNHSRGIAASLVVAHPPDLGQMEPLQETLTLARALNDSWLTAWVLHYLGLTLVRSRQDHAQAQLYGEESLRLARQTGDAWLIARALDTVGRIALAAHATARADGAFKESLQVSEQVTDRLGMAWTLWGLGETAFERGSYGEARGYEEQRFRLEQEFGTKGAMAYVSCALARIALELGNVAEVRSAAGRSLALGRELGIASFIAWSLLLLGRAKLVEGDADGARPLLEESLARSRELEAHSPEGDARVALGWAELGIGELEQAQAQLVAAFALAQESGYDGGISAAVEGLAAVGARSGRWEEAARLFGAAAAGRERSGWRAHPSDRALAEPWLLATHEALGEHLFDDAWNAGRRLQLDQALLSNLAGEEPESHDT